MPVDRHPSKGKSQESVAPDVAHSPDLQMPLAQEKQHLEEIDALIKTMSLEELIEIVMLDVADSKDDSTSVEEKTEFMRCGLSNIQLEEARAFVSKSLIKELLPEWKNLEISFILCKFLNAGEKLKTVTNSKVRHYIKLYCAVLKGYMSQFRYK